MVKPNLELGLLLSAVALASKFTVGSGTVFDICAYGIALLGLLAAIDTASLLTGGFDNVLDELIALEIEEGELIL